MLKSISKLNGAKQLKKNQQKEINGGLSPTSSACDEFAQIQGEIAEAGGGNYFEAYFNAIAFCLSKTK